MTKPVHLDSLPDFLDKEEVAALLRVDVRTVEGWRAGRGNFATDLERRALTGRRLGGRVRYSKALIVEYMLGEDEGEQ